MTCSPWVSAEVSDSHFSQLSVGTFGIKMPKNKKGPEVWSDTAKRWVPIWPWRTVAPEFCPHGEPETIVNFSLSADGKDVDCRKTLPVSSSSLRGLPLPTGSWKWSRKPGDSDDLIKVHVDFDDVVGLTFFVEQSSVLVHKFQARNVEGRVIAPLHHGDVLLSINGFNVEGLTEQQVDDIWDEAASREKERYFELCVRRRDDEDEISEVDPDAFPGLGSPDRPGYVRDFMMPRVPRNAPTFGYERPASINVPRPRWLR